MADHLVRPGSLTLLFLAIEVQSFGPFGPGETKSEGEEL